MVTIAAIVGLCIAGGFAIGLFILWLTRRRKHASLPPVPTARPSLPPREQRARKELIDENKRYAEQIAFGHPGEPADFTQMFGSPAPATAKRGFASANFTLTAPRVLQRGHPTEIRFWAHMPQDRQRVVHFAEEAHGQPASQLLIKPEGPYSIEPGSTLAIRLNIPGMKCLEPQKRISWTGEIASAGFVVQVPADASEGAHAGTVSIRANGMQIAKMSFVLSVAEAVELAVPSVVPATTTSHRSAFASYATEDRAEVVARVQGMEAAYKGLDVFLDVVDFRSGALWEPALYDRILKADIFYLFWCRHSKISEWVEKEWRLALAAKGLDFIDPIPLEEPAHAEPPPELAAKHFNDPLLAFLNSAGGINRNHSN